MPTLWAICPMPDVDRRPLHPERPWQNGDEHVGVDGVEEDLEDRVEGDQARRAYSLSPLASSFQTMTMAIQRASPMRMTPCMSAGLSPNRSRMARKNMRIGPMIQFCATR